MAFNNWQELLSIKIALLISFGISLFIFAMHRQLGAFGVETDFYGSFVPEARRFLARQSLLLEWHPPFYSFLLGGVYLLIGDWFRSGLIISVVSAVFAVGAVYALFRDLYNRVAAWGAALGLALWPQFLSLAITASTDVLFLSLMMTSLAVAVGEETSSNGRSFFAGLLAGLASLTRTNGITLLLITLICARRVSENRMAKTAWIALSGFLTPWCIWVLFSRLIESPVFPSRTYIDIAVTFFHPEEARFSSNSDNWDFAENSFSSMFEVILFDPRILILGFLRNLLLNIFLFFKFAGSLWPLLGCASVFGIFWLLMQRSNSKLLLPFWLIYASQYAVLALRSFDTRYFLFLVPAIAAGVFLLGKALIDRIGETGSRNKTMARLAFGAVLIPIAIINVKLLIDFIKREPVEIIEATALLKGIATGRESIVARKPHIGFYSGLDHSFIPLVQSERELYYDLCSKHAREKTFLFFGREEAQRRPSLRALQTPKDAPDWLTPVGNGKRVGSSWVLYEVNCTAQ
jgi:4-amino-4-deoxy-L-arabinose transferase-like glycosyltransferase